MRILRTAGLVFVIIAGGLLLYKTMYEVKNRNLVSYAETAGEKLISMVNAETGKRTFAKLYQDFLDQIREKKVSPEQVEQTAANLLNLSNVSDTLSPEQVEAVLQFATLTRETPQTPELSAAAEVPKAASIEQWREMEERVSLAFEFNEKILAQREKLAMSRQEMHSKIKYQESGGIKIVLDKKIQNEIAALDLELKKLEKANLIVWREDLVKAEESELQELKLKLDQVKKELNEKQIEQAAKIHEMKVLKSLEKLDSLGLPPPVNVKIILDKVQKEVKVKPTK